MSDFLINYYINKINYYINKINNYIIINNT